MITAVGIGVVLGIAGWAAWPFIRDYLDSRKPELPPASDFEYATRLWKKGVITDESYEALIYLINDPEVEFRR